MYTKKTKIVCTIGPTSWDPNIIKNMIESGMNCARVNGAFADPDELDKVAKLVRDVSNEVSLMLDVKGPEIRLNKFPEAIKLKAGDSVIIGNTEKDPINPANYLNLYKFVKPDQKILVGDGDVELKVLKVADKKLHCKVVYGQILKPGKALNLPGCEYSSEILTEKDKLNLDHAIKTGWDSVSASFIKDKEAAETVRDFINARKSNMKLVAKIEDEQGIRHIDEILEVVDGIMIARGGLGVELGLERVPIIQRILVRKCNNFGKPVITATQMVESMMENPRPTRAEVSDVATAILLGTDCVMLSGESANGKYPVEAVNVLARTAKETEQYIDPSIIEAVAFGSKDVDAITKAAAELCINLEEEIVGVVCVSKSGNTSRLLGRHSIKQPIYCFTESQSNVRWLSLSKGINRAFQFDGLSQRSYDRDTGVKKVKELIVEKKLAEKGQKFLLLSKGHKDSSYFPGIFEIIEM